MTQKSYTQLTYEQRCQIEGYLKSKILPSRMAVFLGVHRSTIYREIKRNQGLRGYRHGQADRLARGRRASSPKKLIRGILQIVQSKLAEQWSPVQISGWMKHNCIESVSHEAIYQHVWADKKSGGDLYRNLRHRAKKYNKRSGKNAGRGLIPGRIDIEERPKIVELKQRVGDWEIDTIIGKNHKGAIVSMVDRATKFTRLVFVKAKESQLVSDAIIDALEAKNPFVLTLTADNGKKFSAHQKIAKALKASAFFAKPYCSWQRGLNEHTNGLVRQYFPKGTPFDTLTRAHIAIVEQKLNTRPRKILNFKTPKETFLAMTSSMQSVALRA